MKKVTVEKQFMQVELDFLFGLIDVLR